MVQVEPLLVLSSQPCLVDASTTEHRCSNVQADIRVCCIPQSIAIIFTPCSSLGSQKCANLRLQWTKYVWRPGSAQTCWASISPPQTLQLQWGPTSTREEGKRREGNGKRQGKGKRSWGERKGAPSQTPSAAFGMGTSTTVSVLWQFGKDKGTRLPLCKLS